ncbi:MAG: LysM peptidoglycan-binding domain-containing protein [Lachnospiraceae bacterium]|nr:LysM peptidoglycan-binding domain-containing protein [Lachnospiraceae bacterium]
MNCENPIEHIVQQGDTLYKLSREYQTTVASIIMDNARVNPYNLQIGMRLKICPGPEYQRKPGETGNTNLRDDMRRAWLSYLYWTRMFLVSAAGDLPDQKEVAAQMVQSVDAIGNVFAQYYPQSVVRALQELLMKEAELTGSLVMALRSGEMENAEALKRQMYQNGEAIIGLLANETSEFDVLYLRDLWNEYLELTEQQIRQRVSNNYEQDIQTFMQLQNQMLRWADYLTVGLQQEKA